jgi:putative tryptophan/tyrosine transport system substrate-binding protein
MTTDGTPTPAPPEERSARLLVEAGGLMSYGASDHNLHRLGASYVDKILRGAKPADLSVEQPTRFELVVNRGPRSRWALSSRP